MNWILTNAGDREFTSPELAQAIDMDTSNMRSKYLMPMGLERVIGGCKTRR